MAKKNILISVTLPLFLFFWSPCLLAQNKASQSEIGEIEKTADSLIALSKYPHAKGFLEKIVAFHEQSNNEEKLATYMNLLARCYFSERRLEEGKNLAERALEISTIGPKMYPVQEANAYDNFSEYNNRKSNYDEALAYDKKSLATLVGALPKNHRDLGESYLNVALSLYMKGSFDNSMVYLDSAAHVIKLDKQPDFNSLYKLYGIKGTIHHAKAEFEQAIAFYHKSMDAVNSEAKPNRMKIARLNGNIGGAYSDLWDYDNAMKYIKSALTDFEELLGEDNYNVAINYMNLGRLFGRRGEPHRALEYTKKALAINQKVYGEAHANVGHSYESIAEIYKLMNNLEQELHYREKALTNFLKTLGEDHKNVVVCYDHLGRIYRLQGRYELSLEYLEKAIAIGTKSLGEENVVTSHIYEDLADTYAAMGMRDEALVFYNKNLIAKKKNFKEKHGEIAKNYNAQGTFFKGLGEYKNAVEQYDKVLDHYKEDIQEALSSTTVSHEFKTLGVIQTAMEGKAKSLLDEFKQNQQLEILMASTATYRDSEKISESMLDVVSSYEDKIQFTETNQDIPFGAIEANFLLYGENGELEALEQAFYHAEKNKSQALKDLLNQNNFTESQNDFNETIIAEKQLKKDRARYLSIIQNEKDKLSDRDSIQMEKYTNALFKINRAYDSLVLKIRKNSPNYFNAGLRNNMLTVADIQSKLDRNTTFLEYFVADSTIFLFAITKEKFLLKRLQIDNIASKIEVFNRSLTDKNIPRYKKIANQLYKILIQPIATEIQGNHLAIVPDKALWHLNFELLLSSEELSNNPKELPYLLHDYAIGYANSASLLFDFPDNESATYEEDCLAFSFSDPTALNTGKSISMATLRDNKGDLPGSRQEIQEIANLIPGNYFYGSEADEANFKANAGNYAILHLALHGEVDNDNPKNSKLFFTKGKDTIEDNFLYAHELFTMQLPAELAVLSACNTGTGKISAGEGVRSLGTAFQYAGTKSLLISGWKVSDKTTPELMKQFYTNLKAGMGKPQALQQAKLTYLKNAAAQRSAPFYWGSFYLVGDVAPISLGSTRKWPYAGLSFVIILGGFFWFRSYRRRTKGVA